MFILYKALEVKLMRIEEKDNGFVADLSWLSSDHWNIQG